MPPLAAELFEEMEDSVNSGWIAFGAPGTERAKRDDHADRVLPQPARRARALTGRRLAQRRRRDDEIT
jgi:hypothetical protein